MATKEHYAKMKESEYHKEGGCVCRHESEFKEGDSCSHRWQGYKESLSSRTAVYNSYDPSSLKEKDLPARKIFTYKNKDGEVKDFRYQVKSPLKDPTCWYIGKGTNFVRSYKVPYLHNYHHMLTNGELNDKMNIEMKEGEYESVLIYLMAAKYNINEGLNIIILPKEQKISRIIKLPMHCPNRAQSHPKYSAYVGKQLSEIAKNLNDSLEGEDCEEKKAALDKLKKALEDLSGRLFKMIVKFGSKKPGTNIEALPKAAPNLN